MPTCYLAHPVTEYGNTRRQREAVSVVQRAGYTIESPDQIHHAEAYKLRGMAHFVDVVQQCDALAFLRFKNGEIGAGVGKEIAAALARGVPVYDVTSGLLVPVGTLPTALSIDATRAQLRLEKPTELHVVALSGGKDSTAMALVLQAREPRDYTFVCTPTGNEPMEMFAHWRKLGELLGKPLLPIMGGTLDGLIRKQNALPNWRQRWCTRMLKIEPFAGFLMQQCSKYDRVISYVGLRADEPEREGGDYMDVPGVTMRFPLREWNMGLDAVLGELERRSITIPKRTDCKVCFFQRLIEWWELWKFDPESYAEGESWEELTGFTFRSPGRDTWPAALKDLRKRFEAGDKPRETRPDPTQCRVCRL